MDKAFASAKREVLAEIVKITQKQGMKGSKGGWKEFLNIFDKEFGASMSDPSRRSPGVLLAFLKTFSRDEDFKFFAKVLQCHANREALLHMKQKSPDNESPEERLVRLTFEHPFYPLDYSFPSYEEGWIITKLSKKSKKKRRIKMIAIDCEMVLCEDGRDALARICVVDRNLNVKLNELVKPSNPVADYRSEITGLTSKHLEEVTCSLADIQKSMQKLMSHGAILVGHSLNYDLRALKIDHARIIDTSLIFKLPDQSYHRRPSLKNLCKSLLGYELRKEGTPHNCLDDAIAAMKLVLFKIERAFHNVPDLAKVAEIASGKILLYRIPSAVPSEELGKIFPEKFSFELQVNKRDKVRKEKYCAVAMFKNQEEAREAFDAIVGKNEVDSCGRSQKLISFETSDGKSAIFYSCELLHENEAMSRKKRCIREREEDEIECKEQEMTKEEDEDNNKAMEIQRLKGLLKERDDEISALHRIVASLARKQGL